QWIEKYKGNGIDIDKMETDIRIKEDEIKKLLLRLAKMSDKKEIDRIKKDIDESSGITETLQGITTGNNTAFEIAQAKEAALKRLKTPLDNILDALNQEGYITVSLMQILYSIPEIIKVTDQQLIEDYLKDIQSDPELFERKPRMEDGEFVLDENGQPQEDFFARVFPEFPLNLEKDEKGNLMETQDTRIFRIKPKFLKWEGIINIKAQSILTPSKQVDKALDLEMFNMLIPLLSNDSQIYSKIAKSLVKLYDKDPKEILPDSWLQEQAPQPEQQGQEESIIIPAEGAGQGQQATPRTDAERLVPSTQAPERPQSIVGRIASRLTKPFR
ncbi:hypothetical protein LCGC14_2804790, partial [marine sediment metagenome]